VGQDKKADPAEIAQIGFKAMMDGEADVVAGFKNKLQVAMSKVVPAEMVAEQHRKMAAPGSGRR
jgi:short-subunit dehydrogenase